MRSFGGVVWFAACALLLAAGCATGTQESAEMEGAEDESAMAAPDTTAESLWAHLEAEGYRINWSLWPGKGELYEGQEPHGMLLTSYMNDIAVTAYRAEEVPFPDGSIIVKENYTPEEQLAAVTVMMKSAGYNPAGGDWFWMKRLADGTIEVQGRGAGCIACHQASTYDWIMTPRPDSGDGEGS